MLNLVNLTIVSIMSMGMASSVMPFDHTEKQNQLTINQPKKANQVNNYTLTLTRTGGSETTFANQYIDNQLYATDQDGVQSYQATSNYVNILATKYYSHVYKSINGQTGYYVQNFETIATRYDNASSTTSRQTFVLQITPYNFNIDTETTLTMQMGAGVLTDSNGDQIRPTNKYYLKAVYQTIQDDWSQYLNRQVIPFGGNAVIDDIQDINNGFYYTRTQDLIEIPMNVGTFTDETIINLTPNRTNYIVIDIIPVVKANYYDFATDTVTNFGTERNLIPVTGQWFNINTTTFSGTNIIPDGTYEVIDLPGLMWEIVTMPFAFVSQAFNLTLFPGTPYQVNISNLFLSIIAIFVFVWLLGFFLKMKG